MLVFDAIHVVLVRSFSLPVELRLLLEKYIFRIDVVYIKVGTCAVDKYYEDWVNLWNQLMEFSETTTEEND